MKVGEPMDKWKFHLAEEDVNFSGFLFLFFDFHDLTPVSCSSNKILYSRKLGAVNTNLSVRLGSSTNRPPIDSMNYWKCVLNDPST